MQKSVSGGKEPIMKLSLPIFLVIMAIGVTFSLAACKNEEPAKEVKKKSSITKEETEEEVKYWPRTDIESFRDS